MRLLANILRRSIKPNNEDNEADITTEEKSEDCPVGRFRS
jgi:hypothetical protein